MVNTKQRLVNIKEKLSILEVDTSEMYTNIWSMKRSSELEVILKRARRTYKQHVTYIRPNAKINDSTPQTVFEKIQVLTVDEVNGIKQGKLTLKEVAAPNVEMNVTLKSYFGTYYLVLNVKAVKNINTLDYYKLILELSELTLEFERVVEVQEEKQEVKKVESETVKRYIKPEVVEAIGKMGENDSVISIYKKTENIEEGQMFISTLTRVETDSDVDKYLKNNRNTAIAFGNLGEEDIGYILGYPTTLEHIIVDNQTYIITKYYAESEGINTNPEALHKEIQYIETTDIALSKVDLAVYEYESLSYV